VEEDGKRLEGWYSQVEGNGEDAVGSCVDWLDQEHVDRIQKLDGMPERTLRSVWWPFTQHGLVRHIFRLSDDLPDAKVNKKEEVMVIDSAHNDCFDAYYAKTPSAFSAPAAVSSSSTTSTEPSLLNSYFDGSASWFT